MTPDPFVAQFVLQYTYKRSLGPILSQFFTALSEGRILGGRTEPGQVLVPPQEYDPQTGADIESLVEVGPVGTVTAWSWVTEPPPGVPLTGPFAWALIRLDGADTALLHVVDAPQTQLKAGLRVQPRWATDRTGTLWDIAAFEPVL